MEFYFSSPDDPPMPRHQVRIKELHAEPRPEEKKVRVTLQISAFQERPSGDIRILNQRGDELASLSFIETISPRQQFTMHLRGEVLNPHQIQARLFYLPDQESPQDEDEELKIQVVDEIRIELIL
ncbi:MAG: hypothetical protein ACPL6F_02790 [Anaerolineales bacterium]